MWSTTARWTTAARVSTLRLVGRPTLVRGLSTTTTTDRAPQETATTNLGDGVFGKIACIGTGKMAQAILHPLIAQGVQPPDQFTIFDAQPKTMQALADQYGVQTANSIPECIADADLVLCAVKPQNLTDQVRTRVG